MLSTLAQCLLASSACVTFAQCPAALPPCQRPCRCMPKRPHEMGILTSWLQEFAWTEAEVARKREERSSSLPQDSFENFCLDCEPLFTFEVRVRLAVSWQNEGIELAKRAWGQGARLRPVHQPSCLHPPC